MTKVQATWECDECHAEFKFMPVTAISKDSRREHPQFCPYCGRESNIGSDNRTSFTKVGILDT